MMLHYLAVYMYTMCGTYIERCNMYRQMTVTYKDNTY